MIKKMITKFILISLVVIILMGSHTIIYIIYLTEADLSFKELGFVNLSYLLTLFIFGAYSKIIINLSGKKIALIFSALLYGIGLWLYTLAYNLLGFISAEVFIAISTVLCSEALKAWLIDTLCFYKYNKIGEDEFGWKWRTICFIRLVFGFVSVYLRLESLSFLLVVVGSGYWFLKISSLFIKENIHFQEAKTKNALFTDFKMTTQEDIASVWQNDIIFIVISLTIMIALSFPFISLAVQSCYYIFLFIGYFVGKSILFSRKMTGLCSHRDCYRWQSLSLIFAK